MKSSLTLQTKIGMNNAFGWCLDRHEKAKMEGRWVSPRTRGRARSLSTKGFTDNFNANGVSRGALVRKIAKAVVDVLLNIMFVVGRHVVNVSSCTSNNGISSQGKHM